MKLSIVRPVSKSRFVPRIFDHAAHVLVVEAANRITQGANAGDGALMLEGFEALFNAIGGNAPTQKLTRWTAPNQTAARRKVVKAAKKEKPVKEKPAKKPAKKKAKKKAKRVTKKKAREKVMPVSEPAIVEEVMDETSND